MVVGLVFGGAVLLLQGQGMRGGEALTDVTAAAPRCVAGCGIECTVDGIHSQEPVYDAAVQVLLNIVRACEGAAESCWAGGVG